MKVRFKAFIKVEENHIPRTKWSGDMEYDSDTLSLIYEGKEMSTLQKVLMENRNKPIILHFESLEITMLFETELMLRLDQGPDFGNYRTAYSNILQEDARLTIKRFLLFLGKYLDEYLLLK